MAEPVILDITKPISLITTREINNLWFAELEIEKNDYIIPKCYVEFNNELYITDNINESAIKGKIGMKAKLHHVSMAELNNKSIAPFTYTDETPTQMFTTILTGTKWTVGTISITSTSTVKNDKRTTCLAALMLVVRQFGGEIYFNCTKATDGTFTRTVDLKTQIGDLTTKNMVRDDKNSDHIERIGKADKLCTRLYIYGKDGLTISSVNGGIEYLDSTHINDYPEPIETTIYTQIDDAARLLTYGQIYLGLYENPLFSYILDVFDKSIFPLWAMETFYIGDKIRVYNKDLDLNVDCRIQRIVKDLTKGTMVIELENLVDKITDLLALLDYYIDNPGGGYYDTNPFIPIELPPYYPPEGEPLPMPIAMSGMYLIKADTLANGNSLRYIARKKIAVDSLGQFWVVYARSDGVHNQIYCSRSTNGQVWTETQLTTSPGPTIEFGWIIQNYSVPVICIDSNNTVYVFFLGIGDYGSAKVMFVKYDGSWSEQTIIAECLNIYWQGVSAAIDSNDVIHLLVSNFNAGGSVFHTKSDDGGDTWSAEHSIGIVGTLSLDNAVPFEISPDDKLHVAVCVIDNPALERVKYQCSIDGGVNWSIPVILNHNSLSGASTVSLAADSQSNIHAIWVEDLTATKIYYSKNVNGIWSHPIVLSNPAYVALGGTISVDNNDNLYVIWSGYKGAYRQLKFRIFSNGSWGLETVQTSSYPSKRYPTLIQAQFPIVNGIRYNISNNGFIVIFTIDDDIWIWFNCDWHM